MKKGSLLLTAALLLLQALNYADAASVADEFSESDDEAKNAVGDCTLDSGELISWLPHKYDCSKFFACYSGHLHVFKCPGNLYFNPELKACEDPETAGCEIEDENCLVYIKPDDSKVYVVYP